MENRNGSAFNAKTLVIFTLFSGMLWACKKPESSPLAPPVLDGEYRLVGLSTHFYSDSTRKEWPKAYFDTLAAVEAVDSLIKTKKWHQILQIDSSNRFILMHINNRKMNLLENGLLRLQGALVTGKGSFKNYRISFLGYDSLAFEKAFDDSSFVAIKCFEFKKLNKKPLNNQ